MGQVCRCLKLNSLYKRWGRKRPMRFGYFFKKTNAVRGFFLNSLQGSGFRFAQFALSFCLQILPSYIRPKINRPVPKIIVAIDGWSSCGKSTLAKALAKSLHYAYVDTGAMYRAVTLFFLENGVDWTDEAAVSTALGAIEVHFERHPTGNHIFLNGIDVEGKIREMRISESVSPVSTVSAVRRFLVKQQKAMGARRGIVMDGRDIGTVVFPEAELKIFLTADPDIRAERRRAELAAKGQIFSAEEIKFNLLERDRIDSSRADSPLRQADDAVVIDNSFLTPEEQLARALELAVAVKNR